MVKGERKIRLRVRVRGRNWVGVGEEVKVEMG